MKMKLFFLGSIAILLFANKAQAQTWQSKFVKLNKAGNLTYVPDAKGDIIPDFSRVGYHQGDKAIPQVKVVKELSSNGINDQQQIQGAINELAKMPLNKDGIRGAILLKKGTYEIPGTININASGIVLRGEGLSTKLVATGTGQRKLISVNGNGKPKEVPQTRTKITDAYVPVGTKFFKVANAAQFKVGDDIVVFRPGTTKWIEDLKMNQIEAREGTVQWNAEDYGLQFERKITAIKGNQIFIDNPVVMAMETQYGGGEIYKYTFDGRISEIGIENMLLESAYQSDTDENHGWDAVWLNRVENAWVSNVTSKYFGYSCVNLATYSKQITVISCTSLAPKSKIEGGRRYSFNNDGQLNLVRDCSADEGRHDYVTGAKVSGPNVFYNCKSTNAKADIGPHHRWAVGTLYDNIITDGDINVQDRGNWGTGHGWAGVTQVLWNCEARKITLQNPYASGNNYAIGIKAEKSEGRLKGRPDGMWEGLNGKGIIVPSLYVKQLADRIK
ncbi:hypothetical protein [Pedobacter xixiisoli]|uniref:Right handed beta helix region n=1 Tax=Pedobacter xixiisoli TaxID=1476464 RepID=A0A285ZRW1_9SPHI|nr:hypothetical protein [Pedobacter xixiisoli]SOD12365.1 hypothetical protein SAMN06297358_0628 [Pedobacter xixiisoli]